MPEKKNPAANGGARTVANAGQAGDAEYQTSTAATQALDPKIMFLRSRLGSDWKADRVAAAAALDHLLASEGEDLNDLANRVIDAIGWSVGATSPGLAEMIRVSFLGPCVPERELEFLLRLNRLRIRCEKVPMEDFDRLRAVYLRVVLGAAA